MQAQIAPSPPVARTAEALGVPGLQLLVDFITEQEEQTLLGVISKGTWHSLARRRVQHYGYEFDYAVGGSIHVCGIHV
jgi:alkylated DNA repair protein alkB family protein 8